jgi:hypothetical protein
LKVIRTWLLVARNSNPSSSHGTSILAVPGFPRDVSSTVAQSRTDERRGWFNKVKADDDAHRAAESGNHLIVLIGIFKFLFVSGNHLIMTRRGK